MTFPAAPAVGSLKSGSEALRPVRSWWAHYAC